MIKPVSKNPITHEAHEILKVNKSTDGEKLNLILGRKDINTGSPLLKGNEYQND